MNEFGTRLETRKVAAAPDLREEEATNLCNPKRESTATSKIGEDRHICFTRKKAQTRASLVRNMQWGEDRFKRSDLRAAEETRSYQFKLRTSQRMG